MTQVAVAVGGGRQSTWVPRICDHAVGMDGPQTLERALLAAGQGVLREMLIGERRIPAMERHIDGVENRAHGRFRRHGGIGMPVLADNFLVAGRAPDIGGSSSGEVRCCGIAELRGKSAGQQATGHQYGWRQASLRGGATFASKPNRQRFYVSKSKLYSDRPDYLTLKVSVLSSVS